MKSACLTIALLSIATSGLVAQAVPEGSQADRTDIGYRRTPSLRLDPFRHVMLGHWGLVISVGAHGENNALNLADLGAFQLISDQDEFLIGDGLDALGLIPRGQGLNFFSTGASGAYLGGPWFAGFHLGFSAQARWYATAQLDDDAVALLRDGNGARSDFSLGKSRGAGLASVEFGVHAVQRVGPIGTPDGPELRIGVGVRQVRPVFFGRAESTIANGGTFRVTGDSVAANIAIESHHTNYDDFSSSDALGNKGSSVVGDVLLRLDWPTNGFAIEAMVLNLGSVTVRGLERRTMVLDLETTLLDSVFEEVQDLEFEVQDDSVDLKVTLPRVVRVGASAWANRILQLDLFATLPVSGEFATPALVDVGSTWRFIRTIPLRAGVVLGGRQGVGFAGGFGIEGRNFLLRFDGQSLGGLFKKATGVAGRFELGFLF